MSIILNEREWAEAAIASHSLGKSPVETLGRVARYYHHCEGYGRSGVREKLEDFLLQCDPGVTVVKWADTLDRLSKSALKYPLLEVDRIGVTALELEIVSSLSSVQSQRLAFTLLCVAKFWNAAHEDNNDWVNTQDKELMKMANVSTSVKRQGLMLHEMSDLGFVKFSKRVDSLNIQVQFIDREGAPVMWVDDFRNLGNQYLMQTGKPFFHCSECGIVIRKKNNAHRFCSECAEERRLRKVRAQRCDAGGTAAVSCP